MVDFEFYDIVNSDDIQVSISKKSHFTIGTSPYYAHQHGLAIDIYQNLSLENYEVLSPISGRIIKIKTLGAPKSNFINGINLDYLILLSNFNNSKTVFKLMHVKPYGNVGDKIDIGDILGKTIRNGYFAYWSSPHLHLEFRNYNDAIRARGGKSFSLSIKKQDDGLQFLKSVNNSKISIKIHSIYPEMFLAYLPKNYYIRLNPFYGVKARVNNVDCILDGGFPHYKIGTVIFQKNYYFDKFYPIYFMTHNIGTLNEIRRQFGFFMFKNVKILLNDEEIRGISLYLANVKPMIKLIPYKKNQFFFKPKSTQTLKIILNN